MSIFYDYKNAHWDMNRAGLKALGLGKDAPVGLFSVNRAEWVRVFIFPLRSILPSVFLFWRDHLSGWAMGARQVDPGQEGVAPLLEK